MDVEANKPLPDWRIIDSSPTMDEIDSTWVAIAQESQRSWTVDNPY